MYHALLILAQEPKGGAPGFDFVLLLPVILLLLYLIVLRPMNRRQERERAGLLANLKKGDKVLTTGGIYGTVVAVSDKEDEVTVKVDDNARLKMTKGSITRNLSNEEAAKAAKDKDKAGGTT
jgi:preprotein translocase subunit YajC